MPDTFLKLGWEGCWPVVHKAYQLFRPLNGWSLKASPEAYHFFNGICNSIYSVYLDILVNLRIAVCLFAFFLLLLNQLGCKLIGTQILNASVFLF